MSILYMDCRLGMTERTMFAGLWNLGLSPAVLNSLPQMLNQPADDLIGAMQNNQMEEYLLQEDWRNSPTIQVKQALAQLKTSSLPVKIREETGQILSRAASQTGLMVENARISVEGVLLLVGILNGLKELKVESLFCSPLPVSIPAAGSELLQILQDGSVPLTAPVSSSRLTLLGAAFLAQKATFCQPDLRITRTSQVTQRIDREDRVVLRMIMGESVHLDWAQGMCLIQTNLDDITPQQMAYLIEKLTGMGALEAYQIPVGMKKNRMGYQLNAVVRAKDKERIGNMILRETPTLGVRIYHIDDHVMASYEIQQIPTAYGSIPVKMKSLNGQIIGMQPEYEVCAQKAKEFDQSIQQIFAAAMAAANDQNQEQLEEKS